jgi:hypothetical protein
MTRLAVVTPSYSPDFDLYRAMHTSVLAHTPEDVVHHVVTPDRDVAVFSALESARCRIWPLSDLIPRRFRAVPRLNVWINVRHPWLPVRGWIMQQVAKLALTAQVGADAVMLLDSDVLLARPVTFDLLFTDGQCVFYREPDAVESNLPRHQVWHAVARELLGLPPAQPPFHDYVNPFSVWDPRLVVALQERVQTVTGRHWMDAIGAHLHFSEDTLYGVFVDEIVGGVTTGTVRSPCHCYWDTMPLDADGAIAFVHQLPPDDVAVMISAKSRTPPAARQAAATVLESGVTP